MMSEIKPIHRGLRRNVYAEKLVMTGSREVRECQRKM